jgi:hypothetical protein
VPNSKDPPRKNAIHAQGFGRLGRAFCDLNELFPGEMIAWK